MLCCTAGAGSLLDNSDKSSLGKKNKREKQLNLDTKITPAIPSPSITTTTTAPVTDPVTELDNSTSIDPIKNIEHEDISQPKTPTSSPGPQSEVLFYTFYTHVYAYSIINRALLYGYYLHYLTKTKKENALYLILMKH